MQKIVAAEMSRKLADTGLSRLLAAFSIQGSFGFF
jgi:hypothetical protein